MGVKIMSAFLKVKERDYEKVINFCKDNNIQIEEYDYAFEAICHEEVEARLENLEYDYGKIDKEIKKDIHDDAIDTLCDKDDFLINYTKMEYLIDESVDYFLPHYRK